METSPQIPNCPNFGPKKQFLVHVLRRLQMTCASELKPHIHNNEDPWEKIHHFKYWNSLNRYPIVIFAMWLLSREFLYLKWWFFSHGSSLSILILALLASLSVTFHLSTFPLNLTKLKSYDKDWRITSCPQGLEFWER